MANDITHYDAVEGYCDRLSCAAGDVIGLCTSTRSKRFRVAVTRWGAHREPVWEQRIVSGREQVTPGDADANGCDWDVTVDIPTDPTWRSGLYLVEMTVDDAAVTPDRRASYACFVLRPTHRAERMLYVVATNTWNAYNDWGGRSLYTGGHRVSFRRPFGRGMLMRPDVVGAGRDDRKSRPRRPGEAPDVDGDAYQRFRHEHGYPGYMGSAGWFTYDRRFVEWAESGGYQLDYAISSDLATVPGVLDGYALVVGAGHDEYWPAGQRDAIEDFVGAGDNYASFSGNTMFWQVRLEGDRPDEAPDDAMVCHKYRAHLDDPVLGARSRSFQERQMRPLRIASVAAAVRVSAPSFARR
jgi:hypothetical protein